MSSPSILDDCADPVLRELGPPAQSHSQSTAPASMRGKVKANSIHTRAQNAIKNNAENRKSKKRKKKEAVSMGGWHSCVAPERSGKAEPH